MRKPVVCICGNKGADLSLCFLYIKRTILYFLIPKFHTSVYSHFPCLYSPKSVGLDRKPRRQVSHKVTQIIQASVLLTTMSCIHNLMCSFLNINAGPICEVHDIFPRISVHRFVSAPQPDMGALYATSSIRQHLLANVGQQDLIVSEKHFHRC